MNPVMNICLVSCVWFVCSDLVRARLAPLPAPAAGPSLAPLKPPSTQYFPGAVAPISADAGTAHHFRHLDTQIILSIVFASAAFAAILLGFLGIWFCRRKNKSKSDANGTQNRGKSCSSKTTKKGSVSSIDHVLLRDATNNFSESNVLGEGGFGCVYKARMDGGILVAVKKMENSGEDLEREFENEMELLYRICHPNIVSLLGHSNDGQTRFLVYELMENGSLESQLHGSLKGSVLTWHIRMKIALDTARGLEYLHEHCNPPVIHRDLKSSNILLDSQFNAKISDFGLAVTGLSKGSVKLSGTLGYVAPEYLLDGKLTEKSDVYAFGVVLLELLMGRKPVEQITPSQCQSIVTWAMPQLTDRSKLPNIVDPVIKNTMDLKHLYQVAAVAVLCIQPEPSYRPLITDVLHSLIPLVPIDLGGTLRI